MDDILGLSKPKSTGEGQRIKSLIRARFGLDADMPVMVSELRCHEDGCPDVETVIAVMSGPDQRETWKIAKPMTDISEGDIVKLV
ncbi:MAG: hypothetical protein NWR87_09545 [Rhodospirillales bacterium]|nr:hypothetical protein [Rhodospirillales bacterium]